MFSYFLIQELLNLYFDFEYNIKVESIILQKVLSYFLQTIRIDFHLIIFYSMRKKVIDILLKIMLKQRISLYIVRRMIMNDFLNMNIYGAVID